MAKRIVKFPLKMKNGAQVRSLEELRANADVESIMQYYFSGQLSRWCRVFNINELPEKIAENNEVFVNRILEIIGVELPAEDIQNYVNDNFGKSDEIKVVPDAYEEKITDDKEVKNRLQNIMDSEINLDDYKIEVTPIENESGKTEKYRVCITNEKTEQYSRFTIPYEVDNDYTMELFEKDLYEKIKYTVENIEKSIEILNRKTRYYDLLNAGDVFEFGRYNGKSIKWKVLKKSNDSIYIISAEELCERQFHNNWNEDGANNWTNSDIRKWLNGEFYNNSFTEAEKMKIGTVESDKVTLLSIEEAESLMIEQERVFGSWCWLRSAYPYSSNSVWRVYSDGTLYNSIVTYKGGVRPALNLKPESAEFILKSDIEKSIEILNRKTGCYELCNVGDTFEFGRYNGEPIKWKVLKKSNDSIYIISAEELCRRQFHNDWNEDGANNWTNSDIRDWLNGEFYNNSFTEAEKMKIGKVESDKVKLLSEEEAVWLMTGQERAIGSWWWLRSADPDYSYGVRIVNSDGTLNNNNVDNEGGVRPALNLIF